MHPRAMGPLGMFGIAESQLERIGYNPLEASNPMGEPMSGGGGGGFSMGFGGQRPLNDMERTIDAHNYHGGFKVATDQYAAKYSDQLDEAALLELKDKYPEGPASGGTWDDFAAQRQANINNYYKTGDLFKPATKKLTMNKKSLGSSGPLSGLADRDRSGLVSRYPTRRISSNTAFGVSPGGGNSRRTGRIGGRYGL